jgi:hypothetical protein
MPESPGYDLAPPYLIDAWRRHVPSITDGEIGVLLPIVQRGGGRLRELVDAYRAGVRAGAPDPEPLAGWPPCPTCGGVSVAAFAIDPVRAAAGSVMVARCGGCGAVFTSAGDLADANPTPLPPAPPSGG